METLDHIVYLHQINGTQQSSSSSDKLSYIDAFLNQNHFLIVTPDKKNHFENQKSQILNHSLPLGLGKKSNMKIKV